MGSAGTRRFSHRCSGGPSVPPPTPACRPALHPRDVRSGCGVRLDDRDTIVGTRDPRIDAYIAGAADFARPILMDVREAVHAACPNVEETMKWRFPHFMYKGMLCGVAAFKHHAAL